jgi:hypothetical protein
MQIKVSKSGNICSKTFFITTTTVFQNIGVAIPSLISSNQAFQFAIEATR